MGRYLRILRRPGARWLFATAVVARLPVAMGPLGMVVLIQHVRGSYSAAGVVTAVFALGAAVGAPIWGRMIDRRGQAVVIGLGSAVSAALLAGLALGVVGGAGDGVLAGLAGGVGLTFPPVSSAVRGAWRVVLPADLDRRAAYALDAVAVETIFVGGPLFLSLLLAVAAPVVPLLVTAGLLFAGGAGYASSTAARRWTPEPHALGAGHRGASPLRDGAVLLVLATAAALAMGFGLNDVSIAATARQILGSQAWVGLLFAAIAGGSATGGLWYGTRAWKGPEHRRLPVTLSGFALGLLLIAALLWFASPAVAGGPGTVRLLAFGLPALFVTGLCIAPGLIVLSNLIDHHGPADRLGEAQAWLATAFTAGSALGTAVAGAAVDGGGPGFGFGAGSAAVAAAVMVALAGSRRWALPANALS